MNNAGIPLFAEDFCREDARAQQHHYDKVAVSYVANLGYSHTQEYMTYLDRVLLDVVDIEHLGTVCELCCGHGEAFNLLGSKVKRGIGVDVSSAMLEAAAACHRSDKVLFIQGDATMLPMADASVDAVFMLGGIHHVNDRLRLFEEVARILKPEGAFYFREPVSDFALWRWIRYVIYRMSPALDHETERPLLYAETVPVLEQAGLVPDLWQTHGFFGFCVFMNSDILVFNRLFRFIPGIRTIVRLSARFDEWILRLPGMAHHGLQVVGRAHKPHMQAHG